MMTEDEYLTDQNRSIEEVIEPGLGRLAQTHERIALSRDDKLLALIANLPLPTNLIRIRFEDFEAIGKGVRLLARNGYVVRRFAPKEYGIGSDEEIELLKEHNVRFDRLGTMSFY